MIVKFENTENSISHAKDKFLKLSINGQNAKNFFQSHIHYDDTQFTIKGDGLFIFKLPPVAKHLNKIELLDFAFWRIELNGLLMELYLL